MLRVAVVTEKNGGLTDGHTHAHTHTHTHRQTNCNNPRCACTQARVNDYIWQTNSQNKEYSVL